MNRFLPFLPSPPRVAVVRLAGAIGAAGRLGAGLNDQALAPILERAFRAGKPMAVALIVNSPGGSPVQSALIGARIRRLADECEVPVHAFVEDAAASGGYWIAAAADQIWVDANSIVGSIGVISSSFGFADLMTRQGVERRVHTAGRSKSLGDPFLPEKPEDVARLRAILEPIHRNFVAHVTARRGGRLAADTDLFQGDVWIGQDAVALGLADGVAHPVPKLRALFGDKVRLVAHEARRPFLRRFGLGVADRAGGLERAAEHAVAAALAAAEERALWARIGL
jgi:serine protease SohB